MIISDYTRDNERQLDVPQEHLFLGQCFGIALVPRGKEDKHICFIVLVEDDENWFVSSNGGSSSWLPELGRVVAKANRWCRTHADPDISSLDNRQYGYKFRS